MSQTALLDLKRAVETYADAITATPLGNLTLAELTLFYFYIRERVNPVLEEFLATLIAEYEAREKQLEEGNDPPG
jgi:hypothetical protein